MTDTEHDIPPDVRAAIGAFLNEIQNEARTFAISEALGAIRRVFPSLEISDADLADAISSEASMAGIEIDFDVATSTRGTKRKALERWEDEGGTTGEPPEPSK